MKINEDTVVEYINKNKQVAQIAKEQILKLNKEKQILLLEEKIQEKTKKDFSVGSNSLLIWFFGHF